MKQQNNTLIIPAEAGIHNILLNRFPLRACPAGRFAGTDSPFGGEFAEGNVNRHSLTHIMPSKAMFLGYIKKGGK